MYMWPAPRCVRFVALLTKVHAKVLRRLRGLNIKASNVGLRKGGAV